jgi:hypothetical protein
MILKQLHALSFENNDIYRLESHLDKIIVNEDYHGIRILDFSLNTIKIIPIIEGLIVDCIYKQFDGNSIMLYDMDHDRLVLINLETYKPIIVTIDDNLHGNFYSRNYYWQDATLIFAVENDVTFYQFNFTSLILEKISQKIVRILAPTFFSFSQACRKHNAITIYPEKEAFIFKKNRKLIAFYDYKNKKLIIKKYKLGNFQDVYFYQDTFIFFHLWQKIIAFQKYKMFINSPDPYYYLRIDFLSNDTIVILETDKNDHKICRLGIYALENRKQD